MQILVNTNEWTSLLRVNFSLLNQIIIDWRTKDSEIKDRIWVEYISSRLSEENVSYQYLEIKEVKKLVGEFSEASEHYEEDATFFLIDVSDIQYTMLQLRYPMNALRDYLQQTRIFVY